MDFSVASCSDWHTKCLVDPLLRKSRHQDAASARDKEARFTHLELAASWRFNLPRESLSPTAQFK